MNRLSLEFALTKALGALKWIVISGVATYAILELSKVLGGIEALKSYQPVIMALINISLFTIAKYREGEDK